MRAGWDGLSVSFRLTRQEKCNRLGWLTYAAGNHSARAEGSASARRWWRIAAKRRKDGVQREQTEGVIERKGLSVVRRQKQTGAGAPTNAPQSEECGLETSVLSRVIFHNRQPGRNPLARPAPAEENAGAAHPLPRGGEGKGGHEHCQELGGTGH
jgi:hypothetical protein